MRDVDEDVVVDLAGLPATDGYGIDRLVPAVVELLGPPVRDEEGARLVARALAQAASRDVDLPPLAAVRVMASWSPRLDYPSGVLREAYNAAEYMGCDCHRDTPEQDLALALVARLLAEPLNVDAALLAVMTNGWLRGVLSAGRAPRAASRTPPRPPVRKRMALTRQDVLWGRWGLNPRPTDYEVEFAPCCPALTGP